MRALKVRAKASEYPTAANLRAKVAYGSRRDVHYAPGVLEDLRRAYNLAKLAEDLQAALGDLGPLTVEEESRFVSIISEATL